MYPAGESVHFPVEYLVISTNLLWRFCTIPSRMLGDINYDIVKNSRWTRSMEYHITRATMLDGTVGHSYLTTFGLTGASPWVRAYPAYDPFRHTPSEAYHAEKKGLGERMLDYLFDKILTAQGVKVFVEAFSELPMPYGWTHIQNPAYHRHSYTYTDVGRVIALTPLVLRKFVNSDVSIKLAPLALIRQEFRLDIRNDMTCHAALTLMYLRFA
jgi:hypothetical protein